MKTMTKLLALILALALIFSLAACVGSEGAAKEKDAKTPISYKGAAEDEDEENEAHTYEVIRGMYSWEDAKKAAAEKGGYLVRFDDADEFEFITGELTEQGYQDASLIIGARRADGSEDYYFVDADDKAVGEKLNAASSWASPYWLSGEPTYEWEGEQEWILTVEYKTDGEKWVLNDVPDNATYPEDPNRHGFIIEYEP